MKIITNDGNQMLEHPWREAQVCKDFADLGPAQRVKIRSFTEEDVIAMHRWLDRQGAHATAPGIFVPGSEEIEDTAPAIIRPEITAEDVMLWNIYFLGNKLPRTFFSSWDAYAFAEFLVPRSGIVVENQCWGFSCLEPAHYDLEVVGVHVEELYLPASAGNRPWGNMTSGGVWKKFGAIEELRSAIKILIDEVVPANEAKGLKNQPITRDRTDETPMLLNMISGRLLYWMFKDHQVMQPFHKAQTEHFARAIKSLEGWNHLGGVERHGCHEHWYFRENDGPLWIKAEQAAE